MVCFIASKIDVLKYAWGTYWWETFIMLRTTTAVHGNHQKLLLKSIIKAYKPFNRWAEHSWVEINHTKIAEKCQSKPVELPSDLLLRPKHPCRLQIWISAQRNTSPKLKSLACSKSELSLKKMPFFNASTNTCKWNDPFNSEVTCIGELIYQETAV